VCHLHLQVLFPGYWSARRGLSLLVLHIWQIVDCFDHQQVFCYPSTIDVNYCKPLVKWHGVFTGSSNHIEGGLVGRSVSSFPLSEDVFQIIPLLGRHSPQIRDCISSELQCDTTAPLKFKFVVFKLLMVSFHRKKNNPVSVQRLTKTFRHRSSVCHSLS
jgi:hypothetical protein